MNRPDRGPRVSAALTYCGRASVTTSAALNNGSAGTSMGRSRQRVTVGTELPEVGVCLPFDASAGIAYPQFGLGVLVTIPVCDFGRRPCARSPSGSTAPERCREGTGTGT